MSQHNHENCLTPYPPHFCTEGRLTDFCDYTDDDGLFCGNEYCIDFGHCECNCHSGKTCDCGYTWPRMEKEVR